MIKHPVPFNPNLCLHIKDYEDPTNIKYDAFHSKKMRDARIKRNEQYYKDSDECLKLRGELTSSGGSRRRRLSKRRSNKKKSIRRKRR